MISLQRLPHDKALHLIAGILIFAIFNFFFTWTVGLIASFVIGAIKELWDHMSKKGTPDVWDFILTGAGGILGVLCTIKSIL